MILINKLIKRSICGEGCVGIGADFDGISIYTTGLENVSKYPYLFAELISRGYSNDSLAKVSIFLNISLNYLFLFYIKLFLFYFFIQIIFIYFSTILFKNFFLFIILIFIIS